jgi:hypothetical protein
MCTCTSSQKPILTRLGTNHPFWERIQVCSMKWNTFLQGEIIAKEWKNTVKFKRNLLQNQPANFNQTWYTSSLGKGNSSLFKKGRCPLQRGDNSKKRWGNLKSSQEPLCQKSSDLHESFLTQCRFNFVKIIVSWGQVESQYGKQILHVFSMGKKSLKIYMCFMLGKKIFENLPLIAPEKFKFTWKLPDKVHNQVCYSHCPRCQFWPQ